MGGLEPPTSPLSEERSNQLSYTPVTTGNLLMTPHFVKHFLLSSPLRNEFFRYVIRHFVILRQLH